MPTSNLNTIRTKVRRLTRSPSAAQISDADLDQYINTFLLFDLPDQLRLFSLRKTLTFYTQPYQDVYGDDDTLPATDPLYDFRNRVLAIHPPIYLAGVQGFYTQNREVFYGFWPQTNTIFDTGLRGTGGAGPFTGTITPHPCLQHNVVITCLDVNGASLVMVDDPQTNVTGNLMVPNNPVIPPLGTINYVTGVFTVTFNGLTQIGATIWAEVIGYNPGKPLAMLYYDNKMTIRPVPDKSYAIQIEVDVQPTELLTGIDEPFLQRAWQYIAFSTAKKIFEDRLDYESINLIMPSLFEQENLLLRSTLTQQANERTVTPYTQGKMYGIGWFGPGDGWPY